MNTPESNNLRQLLFSFVSNLYVIDLTNNYGILYEPGCDTQFEMAFRVDRTTQGHCNQNVSQREDNPHHGGKNDEIAFCYNRF